MGLYATPRAGQAFTQKTAHHFLRCAVFLFSCFLIFLFLKCHKSNFSPKEKNHSSQHFNKACGRGRVLSSLRPPICTLSYRGGGHLSLVIFQQKLHFFLHSWCCSYESAKWQARNLPHRPVAASSLPANWRYPLSWKAGNWRRPNVAEPEARRK